MSHPLRPYFAYGSNMCVDQMALRCPDAQLLGTARLQDYRLLINGRGYATIHPAPGRFVWGLLWRISPSDEDSLDRYEDFAKGLYGKADVRLQMNPDNEPREAMTYIAANAFPGPPRPGYLEVILRAADALGFPDAYRKELASWARGHRFRAPQPGRA